MESGKRFGFSAIEKSKMDRWKSGQSLYEIGRAFDKPHSSIRCLLLLTMRGRLGPPTEEGFACRPPQVKQHRCE